MASSLIRDIITSFSPNLDLFAIILGDGRIKIWDTGKGQVQAEFVDIAPTDATGIFAKQEGHLSMDYTCMKWMSLDKKKKRKLGSSLLVLGTGGGDVLAMDVSAGQVKWRISNCHPGGVSDFSFPTHASHVYTAGADGIVCKIDSMSGNLLGKFSASSRAISSLAVSPDGKLIATAAAQLKIFNSSNYKKVQKFSGHPGAVRCMIFSEDGNYVLSSSLGERYVAVWRIDVSKNKSASSFLVMDHPAVFLDSMRIKGGEDEDAGLSVLAISEIGTCYFWYAKTMDGLQNSKPTKICIPYDAQKNRGAVPNIFAAKLQTISEHASGHMFLAFGYGIKPSFKKVVVQSGVDIDLDVSHDGILLPIIQSQKPKKATDGKNQVTVLDHSNAGGALLPVPKMFDLPDEKAKAEPRMGEGDADKDCFDSVTLCMEDRLVLLGILGTPDEEHASTLNSKFFKKIRLEENTPHKKMKATIRSMKPKDAASLLKGLVDVWQSRSLNGKHVLPWIHYILAYHGDYVKSEHPKLLDALWKLSRVKGLAMNSLCQLSGRLQLVSAQIDKARNNKSIVLKYDELNDDSEDEYVTGDIDAVDDDSQASSDTDE